MSSSIYSDSVERIVAEYERGPYSQSWSFLYGPKDTLDPATNIVLLGLNPGGRRKDDWEPHHYESKGNAYRVQDTWGGNGVRLQEQVQRFFSIVFQVFDTGYSSASELLDRTLTSNLCPFRSSTWKKLPGKEQALTFAREDLWPPVFKLVNPKLVFCLGKTTYEEVCTILKGLEWQKFRTSSFPTGWGRVFFRSSEFVHSDKTTVVAYIPHLARYKLMNDKQRERLATRFLEDLHNTLSGP